MPVVNRSTTVAPAAPAPSKIDLAHFSPTGVTRLRDGGSIIVHGNLNRSVTADVRLDGGLGSATRGKFFVTSHMWNEGPGKDRPATKAELKQLKTSMTSWLSTVRLDQATGKTYDTFMQRLDAAIGAPADTKVTKATTAKLLKSTNAALKSDSLKWNKSMPLGVRYVEVPLFNDKHPDGYSYSAMVPVGALSPTAVAKDPNAATNFVIKRSGGIVGMTTYAGPINVKK